MKIGILTFHNNHNRGSLLQAYCLYNYVSNVAENSTVEIIDYRTRNKELSNTISVSTNVREVAQNLFELPTQVADYAKCELFVREHTTLSPKRIVTNNHKKSIDFINDQDYDLIIVGSDEIWRVQPQMNNLTTLGSDRPFPNAYFLDEKINAHTATYAASANRLQINKLDEETVSTIQQKIESFDRISVRDSYTEKILTETFNISQPTRVPDPTFIYELPAVEAQHKLGGLGIDPNKPIIGIHANDRAPFRFVRQMFKDRTYQIISPTRFPGSDLDLFSKIHPLQYPNMYKHIDLMVTSSLHSTIFSLLAGTPFLTIDTDSRYQDLPSKTHSLLSEMDLTDRHYSAVDGFNRKELHNNINQAQTPIDTVAVESKLKTLRENGREFIHSIIRDAS